MSNKKKLKAKFENEINKLRLEQKIELSDLVISRDEFAYRAHFAESQVRYLMRECQKLRSSKNPTKHTQEEYNVGNDREEELISQVPNKETHTNGVAEHAKDFISDQLLS